MKLQFSCLVVSPAGLTCLKEVAADMPRALFSSLTSCQAFRASHRLINPGEPLTTERRQRQKQRRNQINRIRGSSDCPSLRIR